MNKGWTNIQIRKAVKDELMKRKGKEVTWEEWLLELSRSRKKVAGRFPKQKSLVEVLK